MEREKFSKNNGELEPTESSTVSVSLIEKKDIDPRMTFGLENEQGVITEKGDSAYWVRLKGEGEETVEGKFFVSGEGHEKLLVFEPGMPGDSNKWMESKFVPELLRQGYSIFCVRHNGTRINVENSDSYVNCPERVGKEEGDESAVIGQVNRKREYTAEDITNEPRIAITALQDKFKQIDLVAHSNGVNGIAYSLAKLPKEITDKVHSFVGLAGFVSRYNEGQDQFDPEGRFNSERMEKMFESFKRIINLGDAKKNVALLKNILDTIYKASLPENINLVLVNAPKDEVIPLETSRQYQDFIGRGLRIVDETQNEPEFHDLKNLQPKTLLRLLQMYHPKRKHTVVVKK